MAPRIVMSMHAMRIVHEAQKWPLLMLGFFTTR